MAISIQNNIIYWPIERGVDAMLTLTSGTGWAQYEDLTMDFKYSENLDQAPTLRIRVAQGMTISGNSLNIALTYVQTAKFRAGKLFSDIKLKQAGKVVEVIKFIIPVSNTVTKMP